MRQQLDNIMWDCLSGPHKKCSVGTAGIRRNAPGFFPMIGFADVINPDFAAHVDQALELALLTKLQFL